MNKNNSNREKSLTITMLMTPDKANFSGKYVHGGEILKMMDHVAYACASKYCGSYVVTYAVDMVLFKNPIKIGSLVTFYASINYTGKSSMEVGIKVVSEDIKDFSLKNTNVCYFTMVATDKDGNSINVPPLELVTEIEKRRYSDALKRKEIRMNSKHCIK